MDGVVSLDPCQTVQKPNVIPTLNIGVVRSMVSVEVLQSTANVTLASTIVPFRLTKKSDLIAVAAKNSPYLMDLLRNALVLVLIIVAQNSAFVGQQTIVIVLNATIIAAHLLQETSQFLSTKKFEEIVAVVPNFHCLTVLQVSVRVMDPTTAAQNGDIVDLELITAPVQLAQISGHKVKG